MDFDLSVPGESVDVIVAPGETMCVTRLSLDVAQIYFLDEDGDRIPRPRYAAVRNETADIDLDGLETFYIARGQRYSVRVGDQTAAFFDPTPSGWTVFA